ncbi:MAG: GntR family transcriptional regulator [Brevefilum sp.]|nr:GntR family transcriptional regulator [Brevefilum sp.]MDT8381940.1 GntR family transcriptional regulator [Brevefilum sp.]
MTNTISTYQRLQNDLSDIIHDAPRGTKLPSEPELAKNLGVSRATLREAMRTFESQGLLRRRQGLGTFVHGPAQVIESGLEVLESIETQAEKIGLEVTMGDLAISHIKATPEQAEKLDVAPDTPLLQINRVILTDNAPVAYLIDILPEGILSPEIFKNKFTGSVLDLLITNGEPPLALSETEISATHAPSEVARALDVQRGDTLLLLNAILYDREGAPVDLSHSYFLPGNFRLHIIRKIGGVNS